MLSRKTFNFKFSPLKADPPQVETFNSSGFTLLELLVVLAIITLLAGMSAPAISSYLRGARLRGGAQQIASTLRMARQLAITKRSVHTVYFDLAPAQRQFWVEQDGVLVGEIRTLPETIRFHGDTTTYTYDFTARGTADDGNIYIVDPRGSRRRIVVTGATGHIRVVRVEIP